MVDYIYGVEGLFFYCYFSTAVSTVASCQNRAVVLARSLIFGMRSPGVSTAKLDRPLHTGYATLPGRLIVALTPFRSKHLLIFPTVWFFFLGLFSLDPILHAYIVGDL